MTDGNNFLLSTSTAKAREESKASKVADADEENKKQLQSDEDDSGNESEKNEIDETIVGKGIGNALKVLRDRGLLGKHALVRGRNTDRTLET